MYVFAPSLTHPGTLNVTQGVSVRTGTPTVFTPETTVAAALALADNMTNSQQVPMGRTIRGNMQSGVVGYKRYVNTPYSASYKRYRSFGRVKTVITSGGRFFALNNFVAQGYTGFFDTGADEYLDDIDPSGSSLRPEAIYNRAVMLNLLNRCKSEARQKASSRTFDVSEALVDVSKTVEMVASRLTQLLRFAGAVRKGNLPAALAALGITRANLRSLSLKDFSQIWLELQYGWKPLCSDIVDGVKLVNGLMNPSVNRSQFVVTRRGEQGLWVRRPIPNTSGWLDMETKASGKATCEVKYRFAISDPVYNFLNGLGVTNPIYTVWVASPYSFLVDWVLPVSDWLQALTAPIGLQFTSGYSTLISEGSSQTKASRRNTGAYTKAFEVGSTDSICELGTIKREAFASWPTWLPYIRFPFGSPEKMATAIALVNTSRSWR